MRRFLTSLLITFFALSTAALADPAQPTRSQIQAFLDSGSLDSVQCKMMLQGVKDIKNENYSTTMNYRFAAAAASVCLKYMRQHHESQSAQYSARYVLLTSCAVLRHLDTDIAACDDVPTGN